jgi:tetratricopeptide (TPR) repeat protein
MPKVLTFQYYWSILIFPYQWLSANWRNHRLRDLLLGLPALVGLIGIPVLVADLQMQEQSLSSAYYGAAQAAMAAKDYPQAELLLTRVLGRGQSAVVSDARFLMAVLMEETGRPDRAKELFRLLAPEDSRGNRAAHRRMALLLANEVSYQSDPAEIQRLHWHLISADSDESPEMSMAWGRYSLAVQDLKAAQRYFEKAVDRFPELWQTLGVLETQTGQTTAAVASFERSTQHLRKRLEENPNDDRTRINYAEVLMKLGRLDEARLLLEQGQRLNPDGPWPWLLASLAVAYHDIQSTQQTPLSDLLSYLERALTYEPNHGPALNRLMAYATAKVEGNVDLKTVLARVIAEGKQPALAHLAMGNLCWIENDSDSAVFHFERAIAIRDDVVVVLNNLAWLLAHDEKSPDLDRALALVNVALEKRPENASFLDTRGSVYLLKKDWKNALTDLEKSLPGVRDKVAVHRKLATIYENLGMREISQQHRLLSEATSPAVPQAAPGQ